jgi:hypothetical protein
MGKYRQYGKNLKRHANPILILDEATSARLIWEALYRTQKKAIVEPV